jgi:hypothetical protein
MALLISLRPIPKSIIPTGAARSCLSTRSDGAEDSLFVSSGKPERLSNDLR